MIGVSRAAKPTQHFGVVWAAKPTTPSTSVEADSNPRQGKLVRFSCMPLIGLVRLI